MSNASPVGRSSHVRAQPAPPDRPDQPSASDPGRLTPWRLVYGIYAWLQFVLIGLVGVALLLCVGPLARRRALIARLARLALRLAGMRVHAGTLAALPRPCVVVANHSSYLDGVLLCALLPRWFSFVIKREMSSVPLAGLLLRRIGAEFVERRDQARVLRDTRRLLRQAQGGQALVFFPEGTFSSRIGLLRFHIGAFAAAARAGLPVVPIAIRGTRHCLPPDSLWPRPGRIDVEPLAPIPPLPGSPAQSNAHANSGAHGDSSARAAQLRERARAALLAALDEPDLAERQP